MKTKTFLITCICGILSILCIVSSIVYFVDPYFQYHKPNTSFSYVLDTNSFSYYNPGIAKNFDYDTVVTGSSMSRSLLPSYIDQKLHCKTVKLSMAEARGKDYYDLFSVLQDQTGLKQVIMGLDTFAFNVSEDYSSYEKPTYLYDENPFNDTLYLTNMDGLIESLNVIVSTLRNESSTSMDEYQNYAISNTFSKEKVLEIYKNKVPVSRKDTFDLEALTQKITNNMEQNIIPFIQNNPEIEFLFYFPPYSIVRWGITENIDMEIASMQIMIEKLITYSNVSIYFFQGNTDVITDLDHYMDTIHFDSNVANQIIDYLAVPENKLTTENYKQTLQTFSDYVKNYDYDSLLVN